MIEKNEIIKAFTTIKEYCYEHYCNDCGISTSWIQPCHARGGLCFLASEDQYGPENGPYHGKQPWLD